MVAPSATAVAEVGGIGARRSLSAATRQAGVDLLLQAGKIVIGQIWFDVQARAAGQVAGAHNHITQGASEQSARAAKNSGRNCGIGHDAANLALEGVLSKS